MFMGRESLSKISQIFLHSKVKIQNSRTKRYVKGKQPLYTIQNRENGVAVTFFSHRMTRDAYDS